MISKEKFEEININFKNDFANLIILKDQIVEKFKNGTITKQELDDFTVKFDKQDIYVKFFGSLLEEIRSVVTESLQNSNANAYASKIGIDLSANK